jgi:tetratricopeptide (TPR) repeat protein
MRKYEALTSLFVSWMVLPATAFAQDTVPPAATPPAAAPAVTTPAPATPAAPAKAAPGADGQRRDPKGVKGISPFWEAIKKGDDALAARDVEGAKAAYQAAIKLEPHNGMGQYRMGEIELSAGHFKEAEAVWDAALRFSGDNVGLKAKVLFVLADAKERQRSLDEERNGWNAYETHIKASPTAKAYPASAADRKKRIDEWKQLEVDYGAVKERIKLRLQEAEKSAAASAQSPQNR